MFVHYINKCAFLASKTRTVSNSLFNKPPSGLSPAGAKLLYKASRASVASSSESGAKGNIVRVVHHVTPKPLVEYEDDDEE